MSEQIQATIYRINSVTLKSPSPISFPVTDILIKEIIPTPNTYPALSIIQYYDTSESVTKLKVFEASESFISLFNSANVGCATHIKANILAIENTRLENTTQYSFPISELSIWEFTGDGINSFIEFKGVKYYAFETQSALEAAANAGCTGGGTGTVTSVSVVTQNGVSGTVANPTTTPAITLDLSVFAQNGTPHEIWVDYSSDKSPLKGSVANGSQAFPFTNIEDAISYADALAISQPLTGLIINFEALPPLAVVADISIPSNLYLTIQCGSFETLGLNKITMSPTIGALCYLKLLNATVQEIEFIDDISGVGTIELIGESANIKSITQDPASTSTILVSLSSFYSDSSNFRGRLNTMTAVQNCTLDVIGIRCVGAIDLGVNGRFNASNSDIQSSVTAEFIDFINCSIPNSVNCHGNFITIQKSGFQVGTPLITFLLGSGTVYFDSESAIAFSGGDIINGEALTRGGGPQLLRATGILNALDSVIPTIGLPFNVSSSALADDRDVIGIVYPSVASGGLALVWQSGQSISNVGLATGTYYRNKVTGGYTSAPSTLQIGNGDGLNFFVNLQRTPSQQIMLSMLNPAGVWLPGEFVGPTAGSSSGVLAGVGFARIPQSGTLTNFKLTQASTSVTTVTDLQIYIAANGIPSLIFYSGVSLGVLAGDWISTDNISTISVDEDDIIAIYNNDFFGWTPNAMTITADLLIN